MVNDATHLTTYNYKASGELQSVDRPAGDVIHYDYDIAHRLTSVTDGVIDGIGDTIVYTLDVMGNRIEEDTCASSANCGPGLSGDLRVHTRHYDSQNHLTDDIGGMGQDTAYAIDQLGDPYQITDALGTNITTQVYDVLGRLATHSAPDGGNTSFNFDALGNTHDISDPKFNTEYDADAYGDVLTRTSPDTGSTTYVYDLAGNLHTKTDARGVMATYGYDALNRLTSVTYPDTSKDVTYAYDDQGSHGVGRLYSVTDPSGTTVYGYDVYGNVADKLVTMAGHAFPPVAYQYDNDDALTGITYPSHMQVTYTRDAEERISSVAVGSGTIVSNITYQPFGPVTEMDFANQVNETRDYDLDYRIKNIDVPGVLVRTFTEDADDNIITLSDVPGSCPSSQTFTYDSLNRLTCVSGTSGTSTNYGYDQNGNRDALNGVTTVYGYDPASNKLTSVGSQTYLYDAAGNLANDGAHPYDYDASGRLDGYVAGHTAYLYNGLGQRSQKLGTPTVTLGTVPAYVRGTVSLTGVVSYGNAVQSVQFQMDGSSISSSCTVTAAPYGCSWDTTAVSGGSHTLTVVVTDVEGGSNSSAPVTVTVDNVAPTVTLTAPTSGADLSSTVNLTATASDNTGISSVQFQVDGVNVGAGITTAPYTYAWDSTTVGTGPHSFTAVAMDTAGNATTSAAINANVSNTSLIPASFTFAPTPAGGSRAIR